MTKHIIYIITPYGKKLLQKVGITPEVCREIENQIREDERKKIIKKLEEAL